MTDFHVVPDFFRDTTRTKKGRSASSDLSRALLNGQTVFIKGPRKTWGSLYTLAKNHGMVCHTARHVMRPSEQSGTLAWFETPKNAD